jgi:hypothetical protein
MLESFDDARREWGAFGIPLDPPASRRTGGSRRLMVYVTRYCALEPASLLGAVRDAIAVLDRYTQRNYGIAHGGPMLVFRNARGSTVTLDVGLALDDAPVEPLGGELRLREAPPTRPLPRNPDASFSDALLAGGKARQATAWQFRPEDLALSGIAATRQ